MCQGGTEGVNRPSQFRSATPHCTHTHTHTRHCLLSRTMGVLNKDRAVVSFPKELRRSNEDGLEITV